MPDAAGELLPLFLKLEGRRVVVVGAGPVAERKVEALLESRAVVEVIAPRATPAIETLAREGRLKWAARPFAPADLDAAFLVFAATSDPSVEAAVFAAAEARRLFCVAVDDPAHASAYSGAVVRRAPFTIAISSRGEAPALSRLLREVLEQALPDASWVEDARALRQRWLSEATPMGDRFAELVRAFKSRAGA